ncbi:MAG: hypothetical protein DWQ01_07315 [Planctomycetota bacterium]|nr:MAG: hypothetical protein DWQ01_07315 [Planctomycetota bacterium]
MDYLTARDLAARFGVAVHQVNYALLRSADLTPEPHRIGMVRVWPEDALPAIEIALTATGALPAATVDQPARVGQEAGHGG